MMQRPQPAAAPRRPFVSRPATVLLLLACVAPWGCGPDNEAAAGSHGKPPRRVVVLAPAAAEMLEALGLLDRVVGIGEFGPWPAAIGDLPVVGGYDSANVERILALRADLLVTASSEAASASHQRLESLGVNVLPLDTSTYDGVFASLVELGRTFDREAEAQTLESEIRRELEAIAGRAAELPRRRTLFVVGRDPLYVAGPGSHVDEMMRMVGATNVIDDALGPYQQVSLETVLERLPEVIIDCSDNQREAGRGRHNGAWDAWSFLPAVHDGRVYSVDPGRLVIPGIRLPEMTRLMGQLVHPEAFGEATEEEMGPLRAANRPGADDAQVP